MNSAWRVVTDDCESGLGAPSRVERREKMMREADTAPMGLPIGAMECLTKSPQRYVLRLECMEVRVVWSETSNLREGPCDTTRIIWDSHRLNRKL